MPLPSILDFKENSYVCIVLFCYSHRKNAAFSDNMTHHSMLLQKKRLPSLDKMKPFEPKAFKTTDKMV